MPQITVSETIHAPVDRVFDVFTDLESAADRIRGIDELEMLSDGPFAVKTKWRETRTMMGRQATEVMWVTALEPNKSYRVEAESHGMHYTTDFLFETVPEGTTVTQTFAGEPLTFMAKLFAPIGSLMMGGLRKCLVEDMEDLKNVCEGNPESRS